MMQRTAELRRLCYHHRTIPTTYKLEGVVREGDLSQCVSQVVEIWKGRYKDEVVALKVLKVSQRDPHVLEFTRVRMPHDPPGRRVSFVVGLTDDIAALQRNGATKGDQTQEHPPFLRGINNHRHLLHDIPLVREWEHYGLPGKEARCQSI